MILATTVTWPGAFLGVGIAFSFAFAIWAMVKYSGPTVEITRQRPTHIWQVSPWLKKTKDKQDGP
jgi:hypothetical protein